MAYTIISQNNSTTTLSDGVNTITVPSRVNLTSGNFTIVEVNNNMATLEDGDGNVYRDIPCVATLAGEGGGGGSVDYSKTVQKAKSLPTADATNVDQVFMYTGATDANYTTNYIYKNVKTATYTGTVSFEPATLSGTTVACSGDNFANFLTESGVEPLSVVSGTMTFDSASELWALVGKDSGGNTVLTFQEYQQDFVDAGFTFTGTPQDGDVVAFTCTVEEASATYAWTRVDVQPTPVMPDPLPSQTGNAGKFLTTDGTDASWAAVNALQNTATGSRSLTINGSASSAIDAINVGHGSKANNFCVSMGNNATNLDTGVGNIVVGESAYSVGNFNVAVGRDAQTSNNSVSVGAYANASNGAILITANNGTSFRYNKTANTFAIGNANGTFEIMSADGTIPTARLTKVNSTITLAAADWSAGTQTVTVNGITATSVVWVSPDPTDQSAYTSAGILCTSQATNSLTFTATTTPTSDIVVNVVCL